VRDDQSITTQRAAEILGVSAESLDKLLDDGAIPQHHIGEERRVYLPDVVAYGEMRDKQRAAALDRMSQAAARAGLYDRNKFPEGGQDE
jgi:excisionase family DNA binding protein